MSDLIRKRVIFTGLGLMFIYGILGWIVGGPSIYERHSMGQQPVSFETAVGIFKEIVYSEDFNIVEKNMMNKLRADGWINLHQKNLIDLPTFLKNKGWVLINSSAGNDSGVQMFCKNMATVSIDPINQITGVIGLNINSMEPLCESYYTYNTR